MRIYSEYEAYNFIHAVQVEKTRFGLDDTQYFIGRYGDFPCTIFLDMFNKALLYRSKNPHFTVPTFKECDTRMWNYSYSMAEELKAQIEKESDYTPEELAKMSADLEAIEKLKPTPLETFVHEFSINNGEWMGEFVNALDNFVKNVEPAMYAKLQDIIRVVGC